MSSKANHAHGKLKLNDQHPKKLEAQNSGSHKLSLKNQEAETSWKTCTCFFSFFGNFFPFSYFRPLTFFAGLSGLEKERIGIDDCPSSILFMFFSRWPFLPISFLLPVLVEKFGFSRM